MKYCVAGYGKIWLIRVVWGDETLSSNLSIPTFEIEISILIVAQLKLRYNKYMRIKYSKQDLEEACCNAESIREVLEKLNITVNNGAYQQIKKVSNQYGVTLPQWENKKSLQLFADKTRVPHNDYFVNGISHNGVSIRKRLISLGWEYRCQISECSMTGAIEWAGKPLVFQVDHINGDHFDNRLENLRFVCPNCHSQTETYARKNKHGYSYCVCGKRMHGEPEVFCIHSEDGTWKSLFCLDCDEKLLSKNSVRCPKCEAQNAVSSNKHLKAAYPSMEEVVKQVTTIGYLAYGEQLGVSGAAIRGFLRRRGVNPLPKGQPLTVRKSLSAGQQYLNSLKVKDVVEQLEFEGMNVRKFAETIHVSPAALRMWLEEKLGEPYLLLKRNTPVRKSQGKVVYPELDALLTLLADSSVEKVAANLGVTSGAVNRHLRKFLPPESFPLKRSGFLKKRITEGL